MCADDPIHSADFNRLCFIRARMTEVGLCSGTFKTFEGKFGLRARPSQKKFWNFEPVHSFTRNIIFVLGQVFLFVVCFLLSVIIPPLPHKHINFPTTDAAQSGSWQHLCIYYRQCSRPVMFLLQQCPELRHWIHSNMMLNTLQVVRLSRIKTTFISAGSSFCRSV